MSQFWKERQKGEGANRVYIVYIHVHRYQNVRALGPCHHVVPLLVVTSDTAWSPPGPDTLNTPAHHEAQGRYQGNFGT